MRRCMIASVMVVLLLMVVPCSAHGEEVGTTAKACVVIDEATGRVLLAHNENEPLPMASTTKIMTALLALENCSLDEMVTCGPEAFGVPGTSIYLSKGETLKMRDMLYGLMLASGNDAATAIAEHVGGDVSSFCRMMTGRAVQLGCSNTAFLTPHGLPKEGHYTTALDLALIAREAMKHPVFREIVSTSRATIPWEGRDYDRVLNNKNRLLGSYEGATGIKTGYTKKAGRCLVFGAERDGMRIIGVVLNCWEWFDEAERLLDLAFERYEACTMLSAGDAAGETVILNGAVDSIPVILGADLQGLIAKGTTPTVEIELPDSMGAPVMKGQQLGVARLVSGGQTVAQAPLIAACDAERDDFPARWQGYWHEWLLIR